MSRIIAGATGLIGKHLVHHWLSTHHDITVISRYPQEAQKLFGSKVKTLSWEDLSLESFLTAEVVVNLAGTNIGEKRWTQARKEEILQSREKTTQKIAALLAEMGPASPPLFNASAIGVYGLQPQQPNALPEAYTEDSQIDLSHAPDFLSQVARRWENAAEPAFSQGVRVVFLRFGVVLAKEAGALPKLVQPFKWLLGGPLGRGQQPFSWVALPDVIRAIDFLLSQPHVTGPFNIVAPECVSSRALAAAISHLLKRPNWLSMPPFLLEAILGKQMAQELLLEGQHVYPKRLLELGFKFAYPDILSALHAILKA